jgi:4-amino-4-deoxy-L-arabinose transferase-like glycosyltransferase
VQPDNLSFTVVSVAFYLAVRAREAPGSPWLIGLLGLTLGALLVTKQHFFLCVLLPTAAMLATRMNGIPWRRRLEVAALLLLPSLLSGSLHLWLTWGSTNYYGPPATSTTNFFNYALNGFMDYYAGITHDSFWGVFGWLDTPLVIRGKNTTEAVQFIIQVFAWLILGLTLWRLEQVGSRLVRLGWRGRRGLALRLAFSDPLLNGYFLFTVFMFYIYIRIDNRFVAQGRNWWPLLLPIFLVAITYAPKALTLRRSRLALSAAVTGGLSLFGAVGSFYALPSIEQRYYEPEQAAQGILGLMLP